MYYVIQAIGDVKKTEDRRPETEEGIRYSVN